MARGGLPDASESHSQPGVDSEPGVDAGLAGGCVALPVDAEQRVDGPLSG